MENVPPGSSTQAKPSEADTKKFQGYLEAKGKLAAQLAGPTSDKKGIYDKVLDFKVANWVIAASARIGMAPHLEKRAS